MPKDIATQMAGILALASSEDYRLPFGATDNVRSTVSPFLISRNFNGAEG